MRLEARHEFSARYLLGSSDVEALSMGELLSLAVVSMTPAMILETFAALAGKSFAMEWVIAAGITRLAPLALTRFL